MLCSKCGYENKPDVHYCIKCGNRMNNPTDIEPQVKTEWDFETLSGGLEIFRAARTAYNTLMPMVDQIDALNAQKAKMRAPGLSKGFLGLIIPGGVFTLLALYLIVILYDASIGMTADSCSQVSVPVVLMLLVGIGLLAAGILRLKSSIKNRDESLNAYNASVDALQKKILIAQSLLKKEGAKHTVLAFFPQDCFEEYAINRGIHYLETKQAVSYKEALRMCQDDIHRKRMEEMQREMLDAQYRIEKETIRARKAATVSAVFSGITAYNVYKIRKQ